MFEISRQSDVHRSDIVAWDTSKVLLPSIEHPTGWIDIHEGIPMAFEGPMTPLEAAYAPTPDGKHLYTLAEIETKMWSKSSMNYLDEDKTLAGVLAEDNEKVGQIGTTHAALAGFLQRFLDAGTSEVSVRLEDGSAYHVHVDGYRSVMYSPFPDATRIPLDYCTLTDLQTGERLDFLRMTPHLIGNYGFYGGSADSRVAPEKIARFAGLAASEYGPEDPVVLLASGQLSALSTVEQAQRLRNLRVAGHPNAGVEGVSFVPESSSELLSYLANPDLTQLALEVDMRDLSDMVSAPLKALKFDSINAFLDSISAYDAETQTQLMDLVSEVDVTALVEADMRDIAIKELLAVSVAEVDGRYVTRPPITLVDKLACTPHEFFKAVYGSAGGQYGMRVTIDSDGTRHNHYDAGLNEARAKALIDVFEDRMMLFVEPRFQGTQLAKLPPKKQLLAALKRYCLLVNYWQ